jgi:hypothetical protein
VWTLRSPLTERRLFGALLCDAWALEQCPEVELDYFADLHLHFAFMALRNLQARNENINLATVEAELLRCGYQQVDIVHVGETALEPAYVDADELRLDVRWLRRLMNRRRDA